MCVPRVPHPSRSIHPSGCRYPSVRSYEHVPRPRTRQNTNRPTSLSTFAHAYPRIQKLGKERIEVPKFDQHAHHAPLRCRATLAPAPDIPHRRDSLPAPLLPKFVVLPQRAFYHSASNSPSLLKDATELVHACNIGKISHDEAIRKAHQMIKEFETLAESDLNLKRKWFSVFLQLNDHRFKKGNNSSSYSSPYADNDLLRCKKPSNF